MIRLIMGKKGSGKTTLSQKLMHRTGGKVFYFSPVSLLSNYDYQVWDIYNLESVCQQIKKGEICSVINTDSDLFSLVCINGIIFGDYTIVIDELEWYHSNPYLEKIIHYGRHFNISIIGNTRRYTDIPRLLTSQADEIYIFQTSEPRDLMYIKDYIGTLASKTIKSLPKYHVYVYPYNFVRNSAKL